MELVATITDANLTWMSVDFTYNDYVRGELKRIAGRGNYRWMAEGMGGRYLCLRDMSRYTVMICHVTVTEPGTIVLKYLGILYMTCIK